MGDGIGADGEAAAAALARDVLVGRAAQAAAGRQERDGFQEIGLAGTIVADEDDEATGEAQRQRLVIAEIGQTQFVEPHRGRRPAVGGGGNGGVRALVQARCGGQTRIGIRT